jgi:pyruvate,water dikinase
VLALLPPSITVASRLPAGLSVLGGDTSSSLLGLDDLAPREALRLRARWLHELDVRVALELGRRLAVRGLLEGPGDVGLLSLAELESAVRDGTVPPGRDRRRLRLSPPLPAAFRLAPDGAVVAVVPPVKRRLRSRPPGQGQGQGVSPGRGAGPVHAGPLPAATGSVLVVATLDPGLAAHLPGLAGLVAETGSVLSHLAILAREFGIPCVVGVSAAVGRFPSGMSVVVDGTTGEVSVLDEVRP